MNHRHHDVDNPVAREDASSFKPIVVRNWSQFLFQKVFALFGAEEHCDVELVFQDGRTIKVRSFFYLRALLVQYIKLQH